RVPFADGVVDGFAVLAGPQKVERSLAELGVKVDRDNVATVAGFTEEWNVEKRALDQTASTGRPAVDGFPLQIEEAAETAQRLTHIQRDVLPFPSGLSPERGQRHAPCSHAERRHRAEANRAGENRILSVESELAATIGGRQADISEDFIH